MMKHFNITSYLTDEFKDALKQQAARNKRDKDLYCRFAANILALTDTRYKPHTKFSYTNLLDEIGGSLSKHEQNFIVELCLNTSGDYLAWRQKERTKPAPAATRQKTPVSAATINRTMSVVPRRWHGGHSYTGRLAVGISAPFGAESFRSDDTPRIGRQSWVKALTAGGAGAGHSLGELSGAPQQVTHSGVLATEDLRAMPPSKLLEVIDTATSPANFFRAMLAYYKESMVVKIGNFTLNSANINNPQNRKSISQFDSIYRFMKKLDSHNIMTPERDMRFLALSIDVLSDVKIKAPRNPDEKNLEIYEERLREHSATQKEILYELQTVSKKSGISMFDMTRRIESDKNARANYAQNGTKRALRSPNFE